MHDRTGKARTLTRRQARTLKYGTPRTRTPRQAVAR